MYAFLNQNDIDNLKRAIDKMKGQDFDAARKMELLVEAYERQHEEDKELDRLKEEIADLPGHDTKLEALENVERVGALLERALENAQEWRDAKDDEPLDDAVARLVKAAEKDDPRVADLESVLADIIANVDRGEPDALSRIRELAAAVAP